MALTSTADIRALIVSATPIALDAHFEDVEQRVAIESVSSYAEALTALERQEYPVVVIDTDGMAEDVSDLLTNIRRRFPDQIVMVSCSDPQPDLLIHLIHTGVYEFLSKPLDLPKLANTIQFLCERKAPNAHRELIEHMRSSTTIRDRDQIELAREIYRANHELQNLNKTLRKHVSQLTILYQMGRDISDNENWSDALDRFLMALVKYLNSSGAGLLLFSEEERRLAPRATFQLDQAVLNRASEVLLDSWRENPRGAEIHSLGSYEDRNFKSCLERTVPWRFTIIPLKYRNRALGFLVIEKEYRSSQIFSIDYHFLNTIQTILSEEVANAVYISELRQLSRFNHKVLDNIDNGVVTTDLSGNIRFHNQRAAAMCPSLNDGGEPHINALFRNPSRPDIYNRVINSAKETHVMEVECDGGERGAFPARVAITRMHDDNLNGSVLVAIFEDLSDRRQLEAEIRRHDRLRVLGQLSAGVAHEIRNPLTGIATSTELLKGKLADQPELERFTKAILDEIHRLDEIIRGLLNFARPAKPQMGSCELGNVSARAVGLLNDQANKKGVTLEISDDLEHTTCTADSNQLTQVMLNVVLNSIQACDDGDRVQIKLRNEQRGDRRRGQFARIDVIDNGPGVPEEIRASLFDPFVTTKTTGTGLGLAICQQILEEHHGRIDCEFLDSGTKFVIRLPVESGAGQVY